MMAFFAYLLRCVDGSFYCGHTDKLDLRMAEHQTGACGGYTASRLPVVSAIYDCAGCASDERVIISV